MSSRLGIDIGKGGADFVLLDDVSGQVRSVKISGDAGLETTIEQGIRRLTDQFGTAAGEIALVVAGVGDVSERPDPVGLIVTAGFEHLLHLGRSGGPSIAAVTTAGVRERVSADGNTIGELDERAAQAGINRLLQSGVRGLAICLINAQANPTHELRIAEIARAMSADLPIVASHDVAAEAGEYDRALAAVHSVRAAIRLPDAVAALDRGLKAADITAPVDLAKADGGRGKVAGAMKAPATILDASRAGAAGAAAHIAHRAGFAETLVLDLGGAAANVALVRGGRVRVTNHARVDGQRVMGTALDVHHAGTGSQSTATAPFHGVIRLGPVGADGPTVFEANLVLGRIPALRGSAAEEAAVHVIAEFAARAGMDRHQAAEGIVETYNERLANALRVAAIEKGEQPERMALTVCGGAGPLHASSAGVLTGVQTIIVPPNAGALAAMGFVTADHTAQFSQGFDQPIDDLRQDMVQADVDRLIARAQAWLSDEGLDGEVSVRADLGVFRGKFRMSTSVDPQALAAPGGLATLSDVLTTAHERRFGIAPNGPAELVALRAIAHAPGTTRQEPAARAGSADPRHALVDQCQAWFDGGFVGTSVFERDRLLPGNRIIGPALVTEPETTTVIGPGLIGEVDGDRNLLIRVHATSGEPH